MGPLTAGPARRRLVDVAIVAVPFLALIAVGATLPLFGVMILAGAVVGARDGRFEAVWIGSVAGGATTGLVGAIVATHRPSDIALGAIIGVLGGLAFVTPGFLFGRAFLAVVDGTGSGRAAVLVAAGLAVLIGSSILAAFVLVALAGPYGV